MNTKHTPGPLLVLYSAHSVELFRAADIGDANAKTVVMHCERTPESVKYLRTLAAAPELLKALQYIADGNVEHFNFEEYRSTVEDFREKARDAIAKATGEGA